MGAGVLGVDIGLAEGAVDGLGVLGLDVLRTVFNCEIVTNLAGAESFVGVGPVGFAALEAGELVVFDEVFVLLL